MTDKEPEKQKETDAERLARFRAEVVGEFGLTADQAARLEGNTKKGLAESAAQILADDDDLDLDDTLGGEPILAELDQIEPAPVRPTTVRNGESGLVTQVFH